MQVDGYSLDAQRDKLRKYAAYEDMIVVGEYSDEGFSGKNIQGRQEFQRMLNDIQDGKDGISYVLVFKLSRFGRNAADVLNSLQLMQDFGVNLICVEDGIDSSKDAGKLMISVLSAVAEIERENIRTQTMAGREQKAREGKWNGGFAPYGYKLDNGELVIAEDEAEVIRVIYDRYIHTNEGVAGVAKYLNRNGYTKKLRQNNTIPGFSRDFVKNVLYNPVYMGKIAYGRRRTEKKQGTRNEMHVVEQSEFPVYEGQHEAIISEEDWYLAQEKRKINSFKREKVNNPDHAHILSGILKCPCCGKSMYGNIAKAHSKDKKTRYYYYCKNTVTPTGHECSFRLNIEQTEINKFVVKVISAMVNNPRFVEAIQAKIGTQTLDVVRANADLEVVGLAAGSNVEMLEKQIREFHPKLVAVWKEEAARDLAVRVQDLDVKIVSQMGGLIELARMQESDILVTAIVGMIGIRPTMEAILAGKDIALANKETLVTAGHLIMPLAKQFGVQILPVDSEHSAIFQALHGEKREQIHKLLITASGGPFRGKKTADLEKVTLEDTLKHPNWVMGQKITVDSATLVNKGLEVMEARWLFDVDLDHIQVVVQPQSIIHSMVEFEDGAVIAQLGTPDMRLPIQYALCYPDRRFLKGDRLDFHMLKQITFEEPDRETFKGLPMAIEAAQTGGSMPTVFNAANELAVRKFLQKKISFLDIYEIIGQSMSRHTAVADPDLDQILEIEKETYQWIESRW